MQILRRIGMVPVFAAIVEAAEELFQRMFAPGTFVNETGSRQYMVAPGLYMSEQ